MTNNEIYMPGEIICPLEDNQSDRGTHIEGNSIKASIIGRKTLNQQKIQLISIYNESDQPELCIGAIVIGQVLRIKEDRCIIRIIKVDGKKYVGNLEGTIRKQNVRLNEIDKLRMDESFIPGDIIQARMISYGDKNSALLSTSEDHLGVLFAINRESGKLMIPISYNEMICIETGLKEKRIVAKPDLNKYKIKN